MHAEVGSCMSVLNILKQIIRKQMTSRDQLCRYTITILETFRNFNASPIPAIIMNPRTSVYSGLTNLQWVFTFAHILTCTMYNKKGRVVVNGFLLACLAKPSINQTKNANKNTFGLHLKKVWFSHQY